MERTAVLGEASGSAAYRLIRTELGAVSPRLVNDWIAFLRPNQSRSPFHDPRLLHAQFRSTQAKVVIYLLYSGDALCGLATFVIRDWPLKLQLGEITFARL